MKCIRCGHENAENSKFCTSCGAPLTAAKPAEQDTAILIELAEAYTGNLAAAKKIVAENPHEIRAVSQACLSWIRTKDKTLFADAKPSQAGVPTLNAITDTENALRDLDYEERIVVLMHCLEKMNAAEIAPLLSLSEDQVTAYLQSAYLKNNPPQVQIPAASQDKKKQPQLRRKKTVRKKDPKDPNADHSKFINHISVQAKIIIVVISALVLGTFLGIKNFAHNEYLKGIASLESENYADAIEPLLNAKRYGGSQDAGLKLGDAYYGQEDYTKALEEYLCCPSDEDGVKEALIRTYQTLTDLAVADENYEEASGYLQSQYELDEDEHTWIRWSAVQNDGTYTAENGNQYNAWGDPIKLWSRKNGKEVFQIDLEYNDDRTLKSMKEYVTGRSARVIYNQLEDSGNMEASWFPKQGNTVAYSVQTTTYDEHDNPEKIVVTTPSSVKKTTYQYTYDDEQIKAAVIKSTSSDTVRASYDYSTDHTVEIKNDDGSETMQIYDQDNRLAHATSIKENGDIISDISYDFDEDGYLYEKIIKRSELNGTIPFSKDEDIMYTYTATGAPYTLKITSGGSQVAEGYYIEKAGWVILYNTSGE